MPKCTPCQTGAPKLTENEINTSLQSLHESWKVVEENTTKKLIRSFAFEAFTDTIRFVNAIAHLSEQEGHHPIMHVEFRNLTLAWWTHKIDGLHANDFIMAQESDRIYSELFKSS